MDFKRKLNVDKQAVGLLYLSTTQLTSFRTFSIPIKCTSTLLLSSFSQHFPVAQGGCFWVIFQESVVSNISFVKLELFSPSISHCSPSFLRSWRSFSSLASLSSPSCLTAINPIASVLSQFPNSLPPCTWAASLFVIISPNWSASLLMLLPWLLRHCLLHVRRAIGNVFTPSLASSLSPSILNSTCSALCSCTRRDMFHWYSGRTTGSCSPCEGRGGLPEAYGRVLSLT